MDKDGYKGQQETTQRDRIATDIHVERRKTPDYRGYEQAPSPALMLMKVYTERKTSNERHKRSLLGPTRSR